MIDNWLNGRYSENLKVVFIASKERDFPDFGLVDKFEFMEYSSIWDEDETPPIYECDEVMQFQFSLESDVFDCREAGFIRRELDGKMASVRYEPHYFVVCVRQMTSPTGWQKILYRKQPFPDNYSGGDAQFLKELKKNVSVVHYDYRSAVFGCMNFLTHVDLLTMYFVLFLNILHANWSINVLYTVFTSTILFYFFFCEYLSSNPANGKEHGRTIVTLFLFAYAFTPVIRTLTTSISTDTIYATSIITAILSCFFHDYGVKAPVVSYPTSVSSGLSSAIFLLSRLEDDKPTLLLLVVAFTLHAYGAEFRNRLFHVYPSFSSFAFCLLSSFSIYCISAFSVELSFFWALLHVFILFICPLILVLKQTGKCTIHGPWDEAVPIKSVKN
ncbi:hypothetical protein CAEBREN_06698 [Caenorhabditis brenneri]|uniref:Phosphatidylinositol N-acetylglucosaminyltransferase subunit C n=1 Tax=Caenorhabditis brenneri TaxID=135651 RepID=G0PE95_CAEBE|nr:hypothetical protein CAEBREN_06698 [Caenorhabditis brenneri]